MFCPACGNEVAEHFRFCSRCGNDLVPAAQTESATSSQMTAAPAAKKERDMATHVTILAWLLVGSGVLTAILGMLMIFAGEVIRHLPIVWPPDLPVDMGSLVSRVAVLIGLATVITAAGFAASGVGLLYYQTWGRVLAIIFSILLLLKFPLGTAIAIYGFWVLLSNEGREHYNARSAMAEV